MESSGWNGDFSNVSFAFRNRMGAFSVNPCVTFFDEFGSFFGWGFFKDFWRGVFDEFLDLGVSA